MNDTYREDAIAKVFQKRIDEQQREIEGLKAEMERWHQRYQQQIDDKNMELMKYAVDVCPDQDRIIESLKFELSRIREGVGKLYELTDNKTVPYIEGVRDAQKYLDNLIGEKK
jgi:uncharacterized protein (DUF305 family)